MFGKTKLINSDEYEKILKRVLESESAILQEILGLKARISVLELENNDLRNKVLRKIQKRNTDDEVNLQELPPGGLIYGKK